MAKLTFNDIMTKISNVFKSDLYILNYKYCLGGQNSEEKNMSQIMCILNSECSDILKELFPDTIIIKINDAKKIKTDFDGYINLNLHQNEKNEIMKKRDDILELVMKIKSWDKFNLDEENISNMFDNGLTYDLFISEPKIPNVTISKSLFPLIKSKDFNTIGYHLIIPKEKDKLVQLITNYNVELFEIYDIIQYITLNN